MDAGSGGGATECMPEMCTDTQMTWRCSDGTTGGATGRCVHTPDGSCAWEIRECPVPTDCTFEECGPAPLCPAYICPDGTWAGCSGTCLRGADGSCGYGIRECSDAGAVVGADAATATCAEAACGPEPGIPAIACSDGSVGGFTGLCAQQPDGTCAWEIRDCPDAGP